MATETQTSGDIPASDYQTIPKPVARLDPEVQFAPTCMMWCIYIGLGLFVCVALAWIVSSPTALPQFWKTLTGG